MVQEEDVLDTWFSSWLWPFATLGWPEKTQALAKFYPTTVLVSGYDILFFWIARMIMAGLHFTGQPPYRDIFITGMIKDKLGRWMSKSLGNGIDPLDMIEQYGADAVRFCLTILCAQGQDIKLDPTKFEMGRNFANKIWNAYNVFGQFMEPGRDYRRTRSFGELSLVERWMLTRLNRTVEAVNDDISRYRLNEAITKVYTLFWGDYCDWYLELIKPAPGERMDDETIALAVDLYERMLELLHPFMPFITEELWHQLRPRTGGETCMHAAWPVTNDAEVDEGALDAFSVIQEMISGIRNVKAQYGVPPGKDIAATIAVGRKAAGLADVLAAHPAYFGRLARVAALSVGTEARKPHASAAVVVGAHQVFIPLAGMIDLDVERARLQKEIDQKERFLAGVDRKLRNQDFVSRAPAEVVERERAKAADAGAELRRLRESLADLQD